MGFALSPMQLTSPAFSFGGAIPQRHTCEAENLSPPLRWTDVPEGTKSLAVFCHDPDAPLLANGRHGFAHWVLYNLAPDLTGLEEGSALGTPGSSDFGESGYGGPMPPVGHGKHHYFFFIAALDADLQLEPGLTLAQFLEAAEPHVIGINRLVGTYER